MFFQPIPSDWQHDMLSPGYSLARALADIANRVLAFQPNLCVPKTRFCKLVMKAAEDGRRYDAAHVLDGAMRSASVCVGGCRARR